MVLEDMERSTGTLKTLNKFPVETWNVIVTCKFSNSEHQYVGLFISTSHQLSYGTKVKPANIL